MKSIKLFLSVAIIGISLVSCKKNDAQPPQPTDFHQTATTKFVDVNGIKYAYRELGDKPGIPLLMVSSLGSAMDD
jgi:hypothetical protein